MSRHPARSGCPPLRIHPIAARPQEWVEECRNLKDDGGDSVSLVLNDDPVWSGRVGGKATASIGTIKVVSRPSNVRLWHSDGPRRTLSCLGRLALPGGSDNGRDPEPQTYTFDRDGAHYTLSYRPRRSTSSSPCGT